MYEKKRLDNSDWQTTIFSLKITAKGLEVLVKSASTIAAAIVFLLVSMSAPCEIHAAEASIDASPSPRPRLSRPGAGKNPTKVSVGMWLLDIDSIDSSAQNFEANFFVMLSWKDPRLAQPGGRNRTYDITRVWNPRIQVANEIGLVRRTFPEVVDVAPDGTVVYRQRFVGPFSQPLDLNDFPFDTQTFRIHLISVGNASSDIEFVRAQEWIDAGMPMAAGIAKGISLPDWKVESHRTDSAPYVVAVGADVAGFAFDFVAKRDSGYYVWKVILPLLLIVMMSWSVFWIDPSSSGTQIAVATTSMLTLIAYRFAIDSQVPKVSYMTKMDQFIVVGTVLVFLTLMQVVLTARLAQKGRDVLAKRIDKVSRWVFPCIFVVALVLALLK